MKAIILARVSTEEQKEAGNSLPAQIERLKKYCRQKDFAIAKVFSLDESAYKTKRDDFDRALDYLKSNKEKIVVCFDKVDRFSRNVFDKRVASLYELAMKDKIELHFASDNLIITPDISATEKFHFGINLGLAKFYLTANMVLNLAQKAEQIFESSEVSEKRQLLSFLLQNIKLQGKKLLFELKTPFDTVLQANKCSTLLRTLNEIRTFFSENTDAEF